VVRLAIDPADPDPAVLETAAAAIRAGGLVIVPTDTLYGLAADPFNREAVERVFTVKGRAAGQALPLIAADAEQVTRHIGQLPPAARLLSGRFWPGPLTLLLTAPSTMATETTGGTGRVGVRVPDHAVAVALCRSCGRPLTATSANISGQPASADPDLVFAAFADSFPRGVPIDVLLDAGKTAGGPASTIVDVTDPVVRLVRAGTIAWEDIQACLQS
jgi:L-threonylcarbamoyladenylate synthase